jgi:predicted hydrocarbon binding protein
VPLTLIEEKALAQTFRDRLILDEEAGSWLDQTRRYMLIRPEALMGIFRGLPEAGRAQALAALEASIFEQGSDSARAYRAMGGNGDALLETVAQAAPQLGWGRWNFERRGQTLHLRVRNSPFAAGFGPSTTPVCAAISGMMRAVATLVFERSAEARELQCAAMGADECRFEAQAREGQT